MFEIIILAALTATNEPVIQNQSNKPDQNTLAVTCFKSGEMVSGMNKICYYDCLGSTKAITIGSVQLCPLTIND